MTTIAYMRSPGEVKRIPFGFSWTTLFFGFWPSVYRNHWAFVFICIGVSCGSWFVSILIFQGQDAALSIIAARVLLAAVRNHMLHHYMLLMGWRINQRAQVIPILVAAND